MIKSGPSSLSEFVSNNPPLRLFLRPLHPPPPSDTSECPVFCLNCCDCSVVDVVHIRAFKKALVHKTRSCLRDIVWFFRRKYFRTVRYVSSPSVSYQYVTGGTEVRRYEGTKVRAERNARSPTHTQRTTHRRTQTQTHRHTRIVRGQSSAITPGRCMSRPASYSAVRYVLSPDRASANAIPHLMEISRAHNR